MPKLLQACRLGPDQKPIDYSILAEKLSPDQHALQRDLLGRMSYREIMADQGRASIYYTGPVIFLCDGCENVVSQMIKKRIKAGQKYPCAECGALNPW